MFGPTYRDELPDFVDFYEDPAQETIRDLYSRSDILVYPSWVEGYGMPPMEAMACRTAIVSTDVGAVREYSPQKAVSFVPIRDSGAIVNAVNKLLGNPDELEHQKSACFEYIQQFTWEQATPDFESLLETAVIDPA